MTRKQGRRPGLSHIDAGGHARMVDVSAKTATKRTATAEAWVRLSRATLDLVAGGRVPKGDAVETARLAGIIAAKKTSDLIPLCHPLALTQVDVQGEILRRGVRFVGCVSCVGVTGVEMEALTAVSVAALTLYDMVKAVQQDVVIEGIRLLEKRGGKRDYVAKKMGVRR